MRTQYNVQCATPADRPLIRALLAEARLPIEDLDLADDLTFWSYAAIPVGPSLPLAWNVTVRLAYFGHWSSRQLNAANVSDAHW